MTRIEVIKHGNEFVFFEVFNLRRGGVANHLSLMTRAEVASGNSLAIIYDEGRDDSPTIINLCPLELLSAHTQKIKDGYKDNGRDVSSVKHLIVYDISEKDLSKLNSHDIEERSAGLQIILSKVSNPAGETKS